MPTPNPVFVKIENPLALRKFVVESAIKSVEMLKVNERMKINNKILEDLNSKLMLKFKEMENSINRLSSLMPQVKEQQKFIETQNVQISSNQYSEAQEFNPETSSLEEELKRIESMLNNM